MAKKHGRTVVMVSVIGLILALLLANFRGQLGIGDMAVGFQEVAFVRNEQNKGGLCAFMPLP